MVILVEREIRGKVIKDSIEIKFLEKIRIFINPLDDGKYILYLDFCGSKSGSYLKEFTAFAERDLYIDRLLNYMKVQLDYRRYYNALASAIHRKFNQFNIEIECSRHLIGCQDVKVRYSDVYFIGLDSYGN